MGNWITQLKNDNRRMKRENAQFNKVNQKLLKKVEELGGQVRKLKKKGPAKKIGGKKIKEMRHQISNLEESNLEYEKIIERFSEENNLLREESLDAQRTIIDVEDLWKRKVRRLKKLGRILNKWLGKLPEASMAHFKDTEDYEQYMKIYERHFISKKIEKREG